MRLILLTAGFVLGSVTAAFGQASRFELGPSGAS